VHRRSYFPNAPFPLRLLQKKGLTPGSPNTPLAFFAWMHAFTNLRHYKYLCFKADRVTCGRGYASGVDRNPEILFSFSLGLGHRQQKEQNGGERILSPGRDFLIGTLINRNALSVVDHVFFIQMGTSSSQVPEGSPLVCLLKCWKDTNPDNLHKKALIFFCTQAWLKYPLGDQENA
jgi:hypothetical protein